MNNIQFIYRFYNNKNECLYVGKTIKLKPRFFQHKKDKQWWNEVVKIEYAECKSFMIDIYEIYYINKLQTKYNRKDTKIKYVKYNYPELTFVEYDMNLLKRKNKNKEYL